MQPIWLSATEKQLLIAKLVVATVNNTLLLLLLLVLIYFICNTHNTGHIRTVKWWACSLFEINAQKSKKKKHAKKNSSSGKTSCMLANKYGFIVLRMKKFNLFIFFIFLFSVITELNLFYWWFKKYFITCLTNFIEFPTDLLVRV